MSTNYSIREVDLKTATTDYQAMSDFWDKIRLERLPDDPKTPSEERIAGWQNIPPIVDVPSWIIEHPTGQGLIAASEVQLVRM